MIVTVVHYGTAAETGGCWIPAEVFDAPPGTPGFLCEVHLAATSVLRLQIALLLSFIADTPQPGQTSGIYQVMAVAQEPNDGPAPDFLHGVLFKEDIAPDAMPDIEPPRVTER